jgi:hypothetical protein
MIKSFDSQGAESVVHCHEPKLVNWRNRNPGIKVLLVDAAVPPHLALRRVLYAVPWNRPQEGLSQPFVHHCNLSTKRGQWQIMDKQTENRRRLVKEATAALQVPGLALELQPSSSVERQRGADDVVYVRHGDRRIEYRAEVKRNLRPATLGAVLQQLRALDARPLLVSDHINPPMAARLQEAGVEFIDTAGNAWLSDPPLCVWVTGRRPPETTEDRIGRTGRAFRASGLRVLFALLCKPGMVDSPYREIARLAGVAHGTVGWVMAELPKLGYVATYRKERVLVKPERLLREWAEAYARTLRPKQVLGRYFTNDIGWWKDEVTTEFGFNLGGEAAGARVTRYLKPATITLYGDDLSAELLARFRLRKDPQGNVELMKRFWEFDKSKPLVPLPLVYADLLATGETRCIETGEMIYKKIVDGFERAD